MDERESIAEAADSLLKRIGTVLDEYTEIFLKLDKTDAVTDDLGAEMVLAEHNYAQLEAHCELDPYGFLVQYASVFDMNESDILYDILIAGSAGNE